MRAQVEILWLNRLTYRTVIHSPQLTQTRIVNGPAVEEHDSIESKSSHSRPPNGSGLYYPRWLQNFVEALLDPVPEADQLRRLPGSIPVGPQAHPCLTLSSTRPEASSEPDPDLTTTSQICFQGPEPKLASIQDFTRYITFDNYAPFDSRLIPRTLINSLPTNTHLRGEIVVLEPLPQADYRLLKATQYTPPSEQIVTTFVPQSTAESLLEFTSRPHSRRYTTPQSTAPNAPPMHLYIRTDRSGRVREAYRDPNDHYGLQNAAIAQALTLKFKPLLINGIPHQMESSMTLP